MYQNPQSAAQVADGTSESWVYLLHVYMYVYIIIFFYVQHHLWLFSQVRELQSNTYHIVKIENQSYKWNHRLDAIRVKRIRNLLFCFFVFHR